MSTRSRPRLTSFASGGGCATKVGQADLDDILSRLQLPVPDRRLLVGADTADDAAIYRLSDEQALVVTADFFAPVVDDPDDYGAIAATNALSDVYAMGGTPLLALNLVAWPGEDVLGHEVLAEVLRAGARTVHEAGAVLAGGHSVRDVEPKYGLAVVGTVVPEAATTVARGHPGDALVLTKALGTGIVCNALKLGRAPDHAVRAAVASMRTLNREAAAAAAAFGVAAATDVTGFGLLGHARNLARASGCGVEVDAHALPVLPAVDELVAGGLVPGGSRRNRAFADTWTAWAGGVDETARIVATDAQTSGGLLLAVDGARAAELVDACRAAGLTAAAVVGRLVEAPPGEVRVT